MFSEKEGRKSDSETMSECDIDNEIASRLPKWRQKLLQLVREVRQEEKGTKKNSFEGEDPRITVGDSNKEANK